MAIKAVGSTTTIVVSGAFFVILAYKRDALVSSSLPSGLVGTARLLTNTNLSSLEQMVSFFIGSIANGILSKVLKKIINQTRPPELEQADIHLKPSDKGT
jgi:uncharacterized membrane protein YjjB (DUF3815 family)